MRACHAVLALVIAAGCRSTPEEDAPAPPEVLVAETFIEAPYDVVWEHVTQAERFAGWFPAPGLLFGEQPGELVVWGTQERIVYRGTLESIVRGAGLTHTFSFVGFGFEEPPTRVDLRVVQTGPLVYVGLRHDCADAPITARLVGPDGWVMALSRLKTLIETGEPMDMPPRATAPAPALPLPVQ